MALLNDRNPADDEVIHECSDPGSTMKAKKAVKIFTYTIITIGIGWIVLTLFVEATGPEKTWTFGNREGTEKVLIVYDPDPFYNLDEKVCITFGEEMANHGIQANIATVAAAKELNLESFDILVFCSNTYNWAPDWAISGFIKNQPTLNSKPVIAITLGAGSTGRSQKKLEDLITRKHGKIIDSRSLWLMRPNNELVRDKANVQTAILMVRSWVVYLVKEIREGK